MAGEIRWLSMGPGLTPVRAKVLSGSRWKASRAVGEPLAAAASQSAALVPRNPALRASSGISNRTTTRSREGRPVGAGGPLEGGLGAEKPGVERARRNLKKAAIEAPSGDARRSHRDASL